MTSIDLNALLLSYTQYQDKTNAWPLIIDAMNPLTKVQEGHVTVYSTLDHFDP